MQMVSPRFFIDATTSAWRVSSAERSSDACCFDTVSYTHLTLPTKRIV